LAAVAASLFALAAAGSQQPEAPVYPPPIPGNDGHALFEARGCAQCHQIDGKGGHRGPDLSGVGRRLKRDAIEHQITAGGGAMPAFGEAIPKDEIAALTVYLGKMRAKTPARAGRTN
jgi:mono/diheme cytochrome c family protein